MGNYFLLLGGFLALAALGYALRLRWPFPAKLLMISSGVCCAGLMAWQARDTLGVSASRTPESYNATTSYVLAQHVARDLGGQCGRVLLICPPDPRMTAGERDDLTYVFARVLRSAPGLEVDAWNLPDVKLSKEGSPSLADFEQALASAQGAVACVSFIGAPAGIESSSALKSASFPRLYVYDASGGTNWLEGLKKGVIRCVIAPRPGTRPARVGEVQGRPEEVFSRYFILATPETAERVAAQLTGN